VRVFVAVNISQEAEKEIEKLIKKLKKKRWSVKWEPIEKIHLTLAFFGSVKDSDIKSIKSAIQKAAAEVNPFRVSFKGLGCFPYFDWPRIIWLGLKGDLKSLAQLQKKIEKNLISSGFSFKPRPFSPHLTLGRLKGIKSKHRREIGRQLKKMRILDLKSITLIDKVFIYQSHCLASGSIYKKLAKIKLEI
jgi:2'-5' RNA ligase